ncbi:hypothetical protein B0T20DRAFT_112927 [Sordaria brevicollis]|uniref:Uncharacterized protein n=1 Tax=Sordaria brevicollis TaxID=83679 RepID=A0AAE0PK28_SORBR|nr:hypothetical protein B0T20DRAFT_112927 [Sordaria brevicollis]
MSGFEIAGIVLAVVPAALKLYTVYAEYFPSVKKFKNDLHLLHQGLDTEQVRFINTFERLLRPILGETMSIVRLLELKNEKHPKWKQLEPLIHSRLIMLLDFTHDKYIEQMGEFRKSSKELQIKLKLPDPEEDPDYYRDKKYNHGVYLDKKSVLKAWASRTGFSLRKKSYQETLDRLSKSNTLLEQFTTVALEQKIARTVSAKDNATMLLRELLRSLFMALGDALSDCKCDLPHSVYLELVSRRDLLFTKGRESEEKVARGRIDFHLVLNSANYTHDFMRVQRRWVAVRVQCCNFSPSSPPLLSPTSPSHSTTSLPNLSQVTSNSSDPGKVRFSGDAGFPQSVLTRQRLHHDPLRPTTGGSTTSLPAYMNGGPVGPLSPPGVPRPATTGKLKFKDLLARSAKSRKKVAFSDDTESPTSITALAEKSLMNFASLEPTKLINVCDITLAKGKKPASDPDYCHGHFLAVKHGRKFALYPPREQEQEEEIENPDNNSNNKTKPKYIPQSLAAEPLEFRTTLTLRQILDSDLQGRIRVPRPDFGDRIRMAVAISASVVQMDSTPWLSKPLTLDDIVFLVDQSSITAEKFQLRPFISKPVAPSADSPEQGQSRTHYTKHNGNPPLTPSPAYPTTFYLGLILCQLMLKDNRHPPIAREIDLKRFQVPIPPGAALMPHSVHQRLSENAEGLLGENQQAGGVDYKDIVQWCLETYNSEKGLDDDEFRRSFQCEVVDKLRERYQFKIHDI